MHIYTPYFIISVQHSSVTQSCSTLWSMDCSTQGFPVHLQLQEFAQTYVHLDSEATKPSHPLSHLLCLPSNFHSIKVFSKMSGLCMKWPKYWSFSFNISPSKEYSELISFMIDWFDFLACQGTLKSLLQHHISKTSDLCCSFLLMVQLSHPYTTTGKTIALTRWTFVGKVMSLLFNMMSRLVTAFLPRRTSFNFMASVTICSDFVAQEYKVSHCFLCFPIFLPQSDGTRCHDLCFLNAEF